MGMSEIKSPIEFIKDAGYVLVVRCMNCKNVVGYDDNEVICDHIDSNGNDKHSIDWFCADGERRDDDD